MATMTLSATLSAAVDAAVEDAVVATVITPLIGAAVEMSLHTADPGATGADEVTGGSYARQSVTLVANGDNAATNSADVVFTLLPAATVTHVGFWVSDVYQGGGALGAPKSPEAGDSVRVLAGELDLAV